MTRKDAIREQCRRERDDLAQANADNERGIAENARMIRELQAEVIGLQLQLRNLTDFVRDRYEEENAYERIRASLRRIVGRGV